MKFSWGVYLVSLPTLLPGFVHSGNWFIYPGQAHGIRHHQAKDKQMDWFMDYLEPETKDAYLVDKETTPAKES